MAEEVQYHHQSKSDEPSDAVASPAAPKAEGHTGVEATDRGLFDFLGKKEEEKKCDQGEVIASEFDEKVKVSEEKKGENKDEEKKKHEGLLEKLHRSSSSSSSSSDEEEVGEGGEKKKKKKGKKPNEKCDDKPDQGPEEKKGFLDKIKEKLPGGKKAEEVASPPPTPAVAAESAPSPEGEGKEKKGFLDKIKEKIPGYSSKNEEEKEKEKEKEGACH